MKCDADERRRRRLDGGEQLFLPQAKMQTNLDTRTKREVIAFAAGKMRTNLDTQIK